MGIDSEIWIPSAEMTVERVTAVAKSLDSWTSVAQYPASDPHFPGWIEVSLLSRWFGPGYLRGYWPHIRRLLEAYRREAPGVRYGDDSIWDPEASEPVTDEMLAARDALWKSTSRE